MSTYWHSTARNSSLAFEIIEADAPIQKAMEFNENLVKAQNQMSNEQNIINLI